MWFILVALLQIIVLANARPHHHIYMITAAAVLVILRGRGYITIVKKHLGLFSSLQLLLTQIVSCRGLLTLLENYDIAIAQSWNLK